jgi:small subunit ribosomal protein S16
MSTRIRLRRMGANKRPFYRVVVADQRSPRDGRFIEIIGKYHPLEDPSLIEIDEERALHWLRVGAQPSNQVRNLMNKIGIWDRFVAERPAAAIPPKPGQAERPTRSKVSKKAAAKAADAAKTAASPPPQPVAAAEATPAAVPEPVQNAVAPEAPGPEAAAPEAPGPEAAAPEPPDEAPSRTGEASASEDVSEVSTEE